MHVKALWESLYRHYVNKVYYYYFHVKCVLHKLDHVICEVSALNWISFFDWLLIIFEVLFWFMPKINVIVHLADVGVLHSFNLKPFEINNKVCLVLQTRAATCALTDNERFNENILTCCHR